MQSRCIRALSGIHLYLRLRPGRAYLLSLSALPRIVCTPPQARVLLDTLIGRLWVSIPPVKQSTSRDSCGPSMTTMTPPWAGGGKLRPGCADGNTGPAHRQKFGCETRKREARRGESKGREGHGRHIAGDSGTHPTDIIVVGAGRLDSVTKELAIAQEPERGKPGTNVGGLFRPPLSLSSRSALIARKHD